MKESPESPEFAFLDLKAEVDRSNKPNSNCEIGSVLIHLDI